MQSITQHRKHTTASLLLTHLIDPSPFRDPTPLLPPGVKLLGMETTENGRYIVLTQIDGMTVPSVFPTLADVERALEPENMGQFVALVRSHRRECTMRVLGGMNGGRSGKKKGKGGRHG